MRPQAAAPDASRRGGESEAEGVDGVAVQRTREVEDACGEKEVMKVTTYTGGSWAANERHLAMLGEGWADRGVVLVQEHKLVCEDDTKDKAEKLRGAAWKSIWGRATPTIGPRCKPGASSGTAVLVTEPLAAVDGLVLGATVTGGP